MRVVLTAANLSAQPDGVHLDGHGSITSDGRTRAVDVNDVVWGDPALCHPTAGSADLTVPDSPPMTILFEATGPSLQIGTLPPFPIEASCG